MQAPPPQLFVWPIAARRLLTILPLLVQSGTQPACKVELGV